MVPERPYQRRPLNATLDRRHMRQPHRPKDRSGRHIDVGDWVRIIGVPDLSGMSARGRAESQPVFEYLVGKYKRVAAFDEYGCARFDFAISNGKLSGRHEVGIEPFLLHVRRKRSNPVLNRTRRLRRAG